MTDEKIKELIKRRRRQILIHSCLYYRLASNIISDFQYDMWAKELGKLQVEHPDLSQHVEDYYEYFKDYDAECTSGYQLPISDLNVIRKAQQLLDYNEKLQNR